MKKLILALALVLFATAFAGASAAETRMLTPTPTCTCELCATPRPFSPDDLECWSVEVEAWGPCNAYLYLFCAFDDAPGEKSASCQPRDDAAELFAAGVTSWDEVPDDSGDAVADDTAVADSRLDDPATDEALVQAADR